MQFLNKNRYLTPSSSHPSFSIYPAIKVFISLFMKFVNVKVFPSITFKLGSCSFVILTRLISKLVTFSSLH